MKKYILISLLSLIPLSGWAQKTEDENWNKIELESKGKVEIMEARYAPIKSVWK